MKRLYLLALILNLALSPIISAFDCSSCTDQCTKGWLGKNVDPVCFSGCKAYHLAKCWDLSDPYVTSMGSAGAAVFPALARSMALRNPSHSRLAEDEKDALRRVFGGLVDEVRIHYGADLLNRMGNPPFSIDFGSIGGQTFGLDIYIRGKRNDYDWVNRVALIGHELVHTKQWDSRGRSFERFGRDYFESFAAGGGYSNMKMESEAFDLEDKIARAAHRMYAQLIQVRPWSLEICNRSEFGNIQVAVAYDSSAETGGFVLRPIVNSLGWYSVPFNQCKTLVKNPDGSQPVYAFATSSTRAKEKVWTGEGQNFCVDTKNRFRLDQASRCNKPNQERVRFLRFNNPSTPDRVVDKATWFLDGRKTVLKVCNWTSDKIAVARLRYDDGIWSSAGWFGFDPGKCEDWNFSGYVGPVYLYAERSGRVSVTPGQPDQDMCVIDSSNRIFRHEHSVPCKDGRVVKAVKVNLVSGSNQFEVGGGVNLTGPGIEGWNGRPCPQQINQFPVFRGQVKSFAFHNKQRQDVQVVLYHPNTKRQHKRYTVAAGANFVLEQRIGDDWGFCIDGFGLQAGPSASVYFVRGSTILGGQGGSLFQASFDTIKLLQ